MPPASLRGNILTNLARNAVDPPMSGTHLKRPMGDVPVTPGVVAKAVQATDGTLAQIVAHNEIGERLCGWRP